MNRLSYREYLEEKKKRRKWPKINSGNEGSDDIDEPSDVREEWLVVDKEKNCVISKHGDDEKAATIAGRKMDFINYNKTKKLGRFAILATHGKDMVMDKPDQFAQVGDKKKATEKAKKATSKAKPTAKRASTKKPTGSKVKTPGQNAKGGLSTQIGGLIARHMAKMFKEDVNESGTYGPSPGYKNRDEFQAAMKKRRTEKKDTSDWKYSATNFVNPSKIDAVNHPSKVENPRKAAIVLGNKETKPDPYEHDTQTKKWLIHQSLMRRVAKEKSLQNKETKEKKSHNHPVAGFLEKHYLVSRNIPYSLRLTIR